MFKFIRKRREFNEPIELVWKVLTENGSIEKWFMQTDFRPEEGIHFNFIDYPGSKWKGIYSCELISVLPPQHLGFSWNENKANLRSHVWIRLSRKKNGTLMELEHKGFSGWKQTFLWWKYNYFWSFKLRSLKVYLSGQSYQVQYTVRNKR